MIIHENVDNDGVVGVLGYSERGHRGSESSTIGALDEYVFSLNTYTACI